MTKTMTREEMVAVYGEELINKLDSTEWEIAKNEIDDGWDGYEPRHKDLFLNDEKRTLLSFHEEWTCGRKNCYVASFDSADDMKETTAETIEDEWL